MSYTYMCVLISKVWDFYIPLYIIDVTFNHTMIRDLCLETSSLIL